MEDYYIGIDMGTTNIKICAYDAHAREIAQASRHYDTFCNVPNGAEQSPAQWWECFMDGMREVVSAMAGGRCKTISISSHVPSLLPVNANAEPLMPAMIWKDYRAQQEAAQLHDLYAGRLRRNNPASVLPYHYISKLMWFIRNKPAMYKKTYKFLQANAYINYRLTGGMYLDESQAGLNHLFNIYRHEMDIELAEMLDEKLIYKQPKVVRSDECIGMLLPDIADMLGLNHDVKVLAGGVDTAAALLGSNIHRPGEVAMSLGTGANVTVCHLLDDSGVIEHDITICRHITGECYLSMCTTSNAGSILDWYLENIGKQYVEAEKRCMATRYDLLFKDVADSSPGCNGVVFLPYLCGETAPVFDVNAQACFFGLKTTTKSCDMARSVVESLCYSLRHTLEYLSAKCRIDDIRRINVSGGPSKQPMWMQILADILQIPVEVCSGITPAPRGNAIVGILHDRPNTTYESFECDIDTYLPNSSTATAYDRNYAVYKKLYHCLKPLYTDLQI